MVISHFISLLRSQKIEQTDILPLLIGSESKSSFEYYEENDPLIGYLNLNVPEFTHEEQFIEKPDDNISKK